MPQFYPGSRRATGKLGSIFLGLALVLALFNYDNGSEETIAQDPLTRGQEQERQRWENIPDPRLRALGLAPQTVAGELNSPAIHRLVGESGLAYTLHEAPLLALSDVPFEDYDFVISPSEEDTQSVVARAPYAKVHSMGYSPLVLAVRDNVAQGLEARGIATSLGEQNYRVNVAELLALLDSNVTWTELGAEVTAVERASITAPDPELSALATKWAQTVALATAGAESFTGVDEALEWAQSDEVQAIDYSIGETPGDLMSSGRDSSEGKGLRMVVTTESTAIRNSQLDRDGHIGPMALLYPDIQLPSKYSFIALNEETEDFTKSYIEERKGAPFAAWIRTEGVRKGPRLIEQIVRGDMGRMLPEESVLNIREAGDTAAVLAFNSAAVPGETRSTLVKELERPPYAK